MIENLEIKMTAMGRVSGKVVIVTGAASGLGAADARKLASEGATVILTDINKAEGERISSEIEGSIFMEHDVRDEERWKAIISETMARFGRLDVLVNNAGLVMFTSIEDTPVEQYRFVNAVMSEGTFLGCKQAIPAMRESGGGSIINVSSVAALKGVGEIASYTAAKGAIRALTRSVAVHCQEKKYGIRCNVILPGAHDTPMTASAIRTLSDSESALDQVRHHGQGRPEDVANLVTFLASDESRQINGAEIVIDNGETMK